MSYPGSDSPLGLYFHIPFCQARCRYCDFNTYAHLDDQIADYVAAMHEELRLWSLISGGQPVDTVYFGGGTPTHIPTRLLTGVLDRAREVFSFTSEAEITVEANPGTLDAAGQGELHRAGVNRLSLGAQSFRPEELRLLGRIHQAEDTRRAVRDARAAGMENISLDLMYGLPGQSLGDWEDNLSEAIALGPHHLSLYGLTLEDGTPLAEDVRLGRLPAPDADQAAEMYLMAESKLDASGYQHYEISNWARPGQECRHNLRYWRCLPYLGFGAGAHSWWQGMRFENLKSPEAYIERLSGGVPSSPCKLGLDGETNGAFTALLKAGLPVQKTNPVTRRTRISDLIILGLRILEGIDPCRFRESTGYDLTNESREVIDELESFGLLERVKGRLRLSQRGRLLGNEVFQRFLDLPSIRD